MIRFLLPLLLLPLALAASGTSRAADGKAVYTSTCIACHGANGKGAFAGVPDLGPRMAMTDADLSNSILNGMQSKGSTMAMPAKGGNPSLTEADVAAVVGYMRTELYAQAGAAPTPAPAPTAAEPAAAAVAAPDEPATEPAAATDATAPTSTPPADMAAFARGAKAWGDNCSRCHGMHDPKTFNDDQWKVITTHMRVRAGLDGAVIRDITTFLTGSN